MFEILLVTFFYEIYDNVVSTSVTCFLHLWSHVGGHSDIYRALARRMSIENAANDHKGALHGTTDDRQSRENRQTYNSFV